MNRSTAFRLVLLLVLPVGASATPLPIKVACIGDSITEGAGLSSPSTESYPARIQRLLGTNFVVRNYGISARTLLKKGDYPYWKEAAYTQSRAWGPDIVVIKLGTNDSKPHNWRHGTNFVEELEEFVGSYRTLPTQPRVILCTPAPVFANGAFGISPGVINTNVAPAIRELAARLDLEVIDFHTRLAGHAEWFPDTIHPNTRGMAVMAAVVRSALLREIGPPPSTTLLVSRAPNRRAVLEWPASSAGLVLQTTAALNATGGVWNVADTIPYSDGTRVRLTNTVASARFFRLWQP